MQKRAIQTKLESSMHMHADFWATIMVWSWPQSLTFWSQNLFSSYLSVLCEIMRDDGHWAIQGHSSSQILVPIKCPHATSSWWITQIYILSCIASAILQCWSNYCFWQGYLNLTP